MKLIKKLILALSFRRLPEHEKLQKMTDIQTDHQNNPILVPWLNPTPDAVETQITAIKRLYTQLDILNEQQKKNTEQIRQAEHVLINIFVSQWAPQTQTAIAGDESKAKQFGYSIKGQKEPAPPTTEESAPIITKIDVTIQGQHTLHIINNITKKRKLPEGIMHTDIYTQIDGEEPAYLAQLKANREVYLSEAKKGKFVNEFDTNNVGKTLYYIAVYINKRTKKPFSQSTVASTIVN